MNEKSNMTYFLVVMGMLVFVMLYIWQSTEVLKIKFEYRKLLHIQESLVKVNDRLLYGIERFRTMDLLTKEAQSRGMTPITPNDFEDVDLK
jgi:hypothetical protein